MNLPTTFENGFTALAIENDPKWADAEHSMIDLTVTFAHLGAPYPFTASPNDPDVHGRVIFRAAENGEFGPVAEYAPTAGQMNARVKVLSDQATREITTLQNEIDTLQDAIDFEMATPEEVARLPIAKAERDEWKKYRVLLSRVPSQPGFPTAINWPVKPVIG